MKCSGVFFILAGCLLALGACSADDSPSGRAGGPGGSGLGGSGSGAAPGTGGTFGGSGGTGPGVGGSGADVSSGGSGVGAVGGVGGVGGVGVGGASGTGPEPSVVPGCGSTMLYESPADPGQFGPWPVGVKTVSVPITGGSLTAEIWYPAVRGSEAGQNQATFDLTHWLWNDATKIPADQNRLAVCNCYRDLPIDTAHGPYPGVVFVHGLASFRIASAGTMAHWASRGFVVIAADHWGSYLSDFIGCPGKPTGPAQDLNRDVDALLSAMTNKTGDLAFLGSSIDMTRVGISGHSLGGQAAANSGNKPNVQVVMPIAQLGAQGVKSSTSTQQALFVCGMNDAVNNYTTATKAGYNATTIKKRLVGITAANHLDVTDLCVEKNNQGKPAIQVAQENGVCNVVLLGIVAGLAQCGAMPDPTQGPKITNYVTMAALEETLHCKDRSAAFSSLQSGYPAVGEFLQTQ
jgi:dienelactone hydrolase